jgi:hypothetical protein
VRAKDARAFDMRATTGRADDRECEVFTRGGERFSRERSPPMIMRLDFGCSFVSEHGKQLPEHRPLFSTE